jgi:acetyl esterase/lipase
MAGRAIRPDATFPIWPDRPPGGASESDFVPYLEVYLSRSGRTRGSVIVLPGGGYANRAPHEAAPIAARFLEAELSAFVVHYRVAPNRHPAPLADASRAVRIVRSRAKEWGLSGERIALLGFSAGGHLAGSVGVFHAAAPVAGDDLDAVSCRPDALILCYPVITAFEFSHRGSFANLLGPDAGRKEVEALSLDRAVDDTTPPAFLWHTADDAAVPVENSLLFAGALRKHGVPFELHVYPSGPHGMGLAGNDPHIGGWSDLAVEWLEGMRW